MDFLCFSTSPHSTASSSPFLLILLADELIPGALHMFFHLVRTSRSRIFYKEENAHPEVTMLMNGKAGIWTLVCLILISFKPTPSLMLISKDLNLKTCHSFCSFNIKPWPKSHMVITSNVFSRTIPYYQYCSVWSRHGPRYCCPYWYLPFLKISLTQHSVRAWSFAHWYNSLWRMLNPWVLLIFYQKQTSVTSLTFQERSFKPILVSP